MSDKKKFISLGIDPNSEFVAFGIIISDNRLWGYGTIKNDNIIKGLDDVINKVQTSTGLTVDCIGIEDFINYGNVVGKSSFNTVKNIGYVMAYAKIRGFDCRLFSKPTINKYLSGRGISKKKEIGQIVQWYLGTDKKITPVHCADATGVAIVSKNVLVLERSRTSN